MEKSENNPATDLILDVLRSKDVEIDTLKGKIKALRQATQDFELYKQLATEGAIYVNTFSQDCDGVKVYGSSVYNTIEEYKEGEEAFADSVEGRCSWSIVSKEDVRPQEECGTFGQGWGIN